MSETPRRFPGPDLRGELLDDRYALEDIVGVGGSGNVYAARDRRLGRRVAVKVIHPEYARDEEQRRRIEQEARIGAQIAHEHVAPILDFGTWIDARGEALPYIVMPLLRGRTLREAVLDGPVPWWVAAGWVRELLAGLSALHVRGVIHRDVKLDNCLLVCEADGRAAGGSEPLTVVTTIAARITCPFNHHDSQGDHRVIGPQRESSRIRR